MVCDKISLERFLNISIPYDSRGKIILSEFILMLCMTSDCKKKRFNFYMELNEYK